MKRIDALVVGAGVAGSSAALRLARLGVRVLLVDRAPLPRHKVCGCCLNAEAVAILKELGLGAGLEHAGAVPIKQVVVSSRGHSVRLSNSGGCAVSRYRLDQLLAEAAERAGCEVLGRTSARIVGLGEHPGELVRVVCSGAGVGGQQAIAARVVLVADGLAGSSLSGIEEGARLIKPDSLRGYGALLAPANHDQPRGEVVMRCGTLGYVGTVVLEDGSLDIAAAMRPEEVKRAGGPGAAVALIAEQAGQPLRGLDDAHWRATPPLTGSRKRLAHAGVMVLGDAAGYVEPFTGEGMAWALRSAHAALPIATHAIASGWDAGCSARWDIAYRSQVRHRQWRCRLFSALLRRPALTAAMLAMACRLPARLQCFASRLALPQMFQPTTPQRRWVEQRPCP